METGKVAEIGAARKPRSVADKTGGAGAWFDSLYDMRRRFVATTRENDFESGIWQSTVDKYADPAHFVYELLQNAEDQDATEARFELFSDRLVFTHNGKPFTQEDVTSITGLGNSKKPTQANKIGRFGIGFKSVFVVTRRPCIYTLLDGAPFGFAIEDLVVPVRLPHMPSLGGTQETRFVLPFEPSRALQVQTKVLSRLRSLHADTLLFLRSLNTVRWEADKEEGVFSCERTDLGDAVTIGMTTCVLSEQSGTRSKMVRTPDLTYLVLSRAVSLPSADRSLGVSIAFRQEKGGIVPDGAGGGIVNVYFPTEEPSGFRFRLHAPFLLTDNRANLKREEGSNEALMDAAAKLFADSLPLLRDRGLLSVSCLLCVPIRPEEKTGLWAPKQPKSLFEPFYLATDKALKTGTLLPTDKGGHVSAAQARMARGANIRTLLSEKQLGALYGTTMPLSWLSSEITVDRTPELLRYLRDTIGVPDLDADGLGSRITGEFLAKQTDAWMVRFYEFLLGQEALWDRGKSRATLRTKPIIRLEDGTQVTPFKADGVTLNAFLTPKKGEQTRFACVKSTIEKDEKARTFLVRLGLTLPDVVGDVIEFLLPRFLDPKESALLLRDPQAYQDALTQIARALRSCPDDARCSAIAQTLVTCPFVIAERADKGLRMLRSPETVYYPSTELRMWFDGNSNAWFATPELTLHPDWATISLSLQRFPRALPSTISLTYKKATAGGDVIFASEPGNHRKGLEGFDPDADLVGLEFALRHITRERAAFLWQMLVQHSFLLRGVVQTARRKNTVNFHTQGPFFSRLGLACTQTAWLPDTSGKFYRPSELSLSQLHPDLETKQLNARQVATALGFRLAGAQEVADKLGVTADDLEAFLSLSVDEWKQFREYLAIRKVKPEFPIAPVPNAERRAMKVASLALEAPDKHYETVTRSERVTVGEVAEDKKTYLRTLYTNEDGILVCQICQDAMPFKHEGDYYFVAAECVGRPVVMKELHQNHLALCPNCAAMFKVACEVAPADLRDLILAETVGEASLLRVRLADAPRTIRFVEKHLRDLQAALAAVGTGDAAATARPSKKEVAA